jgi:hypothetical protein
MADERRPTFPGYEPDKLLAQRSLADARLANQHDQGAVSADGRLEGCLELP